jgi:hypothetical protein
MKGNVVAGGFLVAALAGLGAWCLRAGAISSVYNLWGPVLIGVGTFLAAAALISFVVLFTRGRP